jgi:acyl-CoA thioester hydrolase
VDESTAAPAFALSLTVAASDIDELGHASNIAYVRWLQDVAVAHSSAVGLGYARYVELGCVFVIRRQEIDYLRSAIRGDALLLRTRVCNVAAAKCQRETEIVRAGDDVVLARGLTTWGYVDIATGRPSRIPDSVRAAFGVALRPKRGDVSAPR